jgi:hypothetical protein
MRHRPGCAVQDLAVLDCIRGWYDSTVLSAIDGGQMHPSLELEYHHQGW